MIVFRVTVPVEEKESTSLYKVVSVTPSSAYGDLTTGKDSSFKDHYSVHSTLLGLNSLLTHIVRAGDQLTYTQRLGVSIS